MAGMKKPAMKVKKTVMKEAKKNTKKSKVARGRCAKLLVMRGKKEKTAGGLTRDALMRNKVGKIVSKKRSALGKRQFKHIEEWVGSVSTARKSLKLEGFVAINGKSLQGKALYVKAKALRSSKSDSAPSAAPSAPAPVPEPAPAPIVESAPAPIAESAPEPIVESAPEPSIA
mmetsp:Transcript_2621/g.4818  ORF Transcript_2621/g.4818 Transcript_2621/m.4818 type:complete len:172 (+) Transcript_2621:67-582(+)